MADNIKKEGMLKVGSTLSNGKYRIEQYLASGGFGNTYVATDTAFDEKVAIKELFIKGVCGRNMDTQEISISLTENQRAFCTQQEKFRKEARRLRKLNNKHIIHVHDLFDENGTSYYVMDFVDGENLSERIKRTKQAMTESEVMLVLPQILDALECVHNEGIWHLDLKPGNIMIDKVGNIQLIDFGASKQLRNSSGESLSTSTGLLYTPGYASSEQMEQNLDKFGPWTDLYSLGATMYNLLTKKQPPQPSDITENPAEALKMPEEVSKKTKDLILWLMKPNRMMRPQSVSDVKQFLIEPVPAPKPAPVPEPKKDQEDKGDTIKIDSVKPKPKPTPTPKPTPKPAPTPKADTKPAPPKEKRSNTTAIIIATLAIVSIAGGIFVFKGMGGSSEETEQEKVQEVVMKNVKDTTITISEGPDFMRTYQFTGQIADSVGALPQGKGTAKFSSFTYEGNFVNGVCEDTSGKATFTYTNGDKFEGIVKAGVRDKGKYILSDGSYFDGAFKGDKEGGSPYNGKWYNPDGSVSSIVENGNERTFVSSDVAAD